MKKSGTVAMTAQAVALVAAGLALIATELTAAPAVEPLRLRPATEQERRDYDARRLVEALDELHRQRTQSPATPRPEPGPASPTSAGPGTQSPARQGPVTSGVSAIARPGGPGTTPL